MPDRSVRLLFFADHAHPSTRQSPTDKPAKGQGNKGPPHLNFGWDNKTHLSPSQRRRHLWTTQPAQPGRILAERLLPQLFRVLLPALSENCRVEPNHSPAIESFSRQSLGPVPTAHRDRGRASGVRAVRALAAIDNEVPRSFCSTVARPRAAIEPSLSSRAKRVVLCCCPCPQSEHFQASAK